MKLKEAELALQRGEEGIDELDMAAEEEEEEDDDLQMTDWSKEDAEMPFLVLTLDIPPTPLFKDDEGANLIPQVSVRNRLAPTPPLVVYTEPTT